MLEIVNADLSKPLHAKALIELLNGYALDPMGGGNPLSDYTKHNLASTLQNRPGTHVILALSDDEAVGLIVAMEGFSTFLCKPLLNIHDVYVTPDCRGKGIAKQLLEAAEQIAINNGCCKLTLEVLEGNKAARAAYSRFGFHGYELDPKMGKALFWEKKL